jgi:hypothetical protein
MSRVLHIAVGKNNAEQAAYSTSIPRTLDATFFRYSSRRKKGTSSIVGRTNVFFTTGRRVVCKLARAATLRVLFSIIFIATLHKTR